jgi:hypothetical protein
MALPVCYEKERYSVKQESLFLEVPNAVENRLTLNARWMMLVSETLPTMARSHNWPISLDHCFMRVCLDTALGAPWHTVIDRPAIKHLSDEQLLAAISVAQSLVQTPATLLALNDQSIRWRKRHLAVNCNSPIEKIS